MQFCGTCKWHEYWSNYDDCVCVNGNSKFVSEWTDDEETCEEWEPETAGLSDKEVNND